MSIILKILIGLVLLLVLVAVVIATSVFVAVLSHERRWRKCLSDDYKMYSDAREKRWNMVSGSTQRARSRVAPPLHGMRQA